MKEGFSLFNKDLIIVTKNEVYLFTDNQFIKIENAAADHFVRLKDSTESKFTDGKNFYTVFYEEITKENNHREMKASIKTETVN